MPLPMISAVETFDRYEAIRPRLPVASFPKTSQAIDHLGELIEEIDIFLLDAFGVLNVGERAIPGAAARLETFARLGKRIFVLTNSATYNAGETLRKYRNLGFNLMAEQVISSRDATLAAISDYPDNFVWGVAATAESGLSELPYAMKLLEDDPEDYDAVDAFLFLSSAEWSARRQELLTQSIRRKLRPLVVGNPDLVAPRESGLSLEPGYFAHQIADDVGINPLFYGKPFADVYKRALAQEGLNDIDRQRIAMVGDTLHTDILGGAAAGLRTVLVKDHGLLKGMDVDRLIAQSGIVPDFIASTT